jgi:RimJ/RimL family protein N-acetyltransferase
MSALATERLLLRSWRDEDLAPFAALNADPEVMRHFPSVLDRAASDATAALIRAGLDLLGFGLWVVEERDGAPFVGVVGLNVVRFVPPFPVAPSAWGCVEVGWRLAHRAWGKGFAREAAAEALRFGFDELGLPEIVAFTVPGNARSRRVMDAIGMRHAEDEDFEHPGVPEGHALRRHVLYRRAGTPRARKR